MTWVLPLSLEEAGAPPPAFPMRLRTGRSTADKTRHGLPFHLRSQALKENPVLQVLPASRVLREYKVQKAPKARRDQLAPFLSMPTMRLRWREAWRLRPLNGWGHSASRP